MPHSRSPGPPTLSADPAREAQRREVVTALRKMIARDGTLPAERRLSEDLGANRYMVRQAIRILREEGMAPRSPRPRAPLWRQDQVQRHTSPPELWEVRLTVEPQLARRAALLGTPQELALIADLHEQADPDRFERALDVAFHQAVAAASHNRLALFLVERMTEITMDPGFVMQQPPLTRETGYRHHADLVQALTARRADEAEQVMTAHLRAIAIWAQGLTGMVPQ